MALTELRESIEGNSRNELRKVRKEAESEAERILEEAKGQAAEISKKARSEAESEAEARQAGLATELELESKSILMAARASAVEHELKRIEPLVEKGLSKGHAKEIASLATKRFVQTLGSNEILADYGKGPVRLRDSSAVSDKGIILYSLDKRIRLDASIKGILEGNKELMRSMLLKDLFG